MQRLILHSDLNCFYAAVECVYNKSICKKPVAVCGDPERRHGIILAKNYIAKAYGVSTGEVVWQAVKKCPNLVLVPVHFDRYKKYSKLVREIYYSYTNFVEPFGLDEAWLDISKPGGDFDYALETAESISNEVKRKTGLTVSIGVSFTKSFAKLGSDYKKPDAITVISPENYKQIVWPLPVSNMIYIGPATTGRLRRLGINTLGELALSDEKCIQSHLGKNGLKVRRWARGEDFEKVNDYIYRRDIKSVGNSITLPYDIYKKDDVSITLMVLAESVAHRLREDGLRCSTVQLEIKEDTFYHFSAQKRLEYPSCVSEDIYMAARELFEKKHREGSAIRSLGVRGCDLDSSGIVQISLNPSFKRSMEQLKIDKMLDKIRLKYGHDSIKRGTMLFNKELSSINPCADHTVYPGGFMTQ